jgi:holo-[acyl-carrier protein] synthase
VHWLEIAVTNDSQGDPRFELSGETAAVVAARGITSLHLSMSHDAGAAVAFVIAERADPRPTPAGEAVA